MAANVGFELIYSIRCLDIEKRCREFWTPSKGESGAVRQLRCGSVASLDGKSPNGVGWVDHE
jgi:hypothetical protein